MKKTLIALAAVAATAAVSAQSVELYGRMDLGHQSSKVTDQGKTTKVNSLAGKQNSRTGSRLGFRGTEDLGGGLKASFVYEMGINADATVGTNAATRLANLAVSGGFGTVAIGTFNNVFDDMTGASVSNLLGSGITGLGIINTGGRSENAIAYQSPNFNGLTVGIGMNDESTKVDGVETSGKGTILNARYSAGALSVLVGHSTGKFKNTTLPKTPLFANSFDKASETAIKASYNLDVAVPYIVYANGKAKNDGDTVEKTRGYELGATFPMGAFTPYVSFARNQLTEGDVKTKLRGNALGVTYSLSKRTSAYAQVANSKVKEADYKGRLTQVGLIHTF